MGLRSDGGPTLDFTIRIGSTPTFLYFDLFFVVVFLHHNNNGNANH